MTALRVESLTLCGVRCFNAAFTARFAPDGLTVVHGPNESGKSTVLAGIGAVLFGVPTRHLAAWRRDPEPASCCGSIVLRTPDGCYTVSRDFDSHRVRVVAGGGDTVFDGDGNPGGRSAEAREYRRWLHDRFGFDDHDTFEDTTFLRLREDDAVLSYGDTVRELVSGVGAQDFGAVETALVTQYRDLTRTNPWGANRRTDQRIERLQDELGKRRAVLSEADAAADRAQSVSRELAAANGALALAAEQEQAGTATVKRLREIQDLREKRDAADADANRAVEQQDRAAGLERSVADLVARLNRDFADVAGVSRDDAEALAEAQERGEAAAAAERAAAAVPDPGPEPALRAWPILMAAGLAVGAGVAVGFASVVAGSAVGLLGLAAAAGWAVYARRTYAARCAAYDTVQLKKQAAAANATAARARAETSLARVSAPLRDRNAAALRARLHARDLVEQELRLAREAQAQLPGADGLDAAVRGATVKLGTCDARLEALGAARLTATDLTRELQAAERQIAQAERAVATARSGRDAALLAQGQVAATSFPPVAVLREEIVELEEQLGALELRRDALHIAIDTLRAAVQDFQRDHVGPIAAEATALFRAFSRDGWEVNLAHEGLEPDVRWEGRRWDVGRLSAGTRDQLAVALRLAVVQALRGRVGLPLLLDDPLAHWDAARRAAFRATLEDLARAHQVILATPDPALAAWGEAQVALGG